MPNIFATPKDGDLPPQLPLSGEELVPPQSALEDIDLAVEIDPSLGLQLAGLTKNFGDHVAVNNLSLNIPAGSFYGLVGPNGAGKSTTLNMATGLLMPTLGTAYILGHDIWADPQGAKPLLGVLPDGMHMFDRLSGREHLYYVALIRGLDKDTARQRAEDLLVTLDLGDAHNRLVSEYSTGMRKKIGLGCALIGAPQVLVLDEPFEAVDPISARKIQSILLQFVAGGGTVILSSHVMATVQKLCTHVAIIDKGKVLVSGSVEQVAAGGDLEDEFAHLVGDQGETGELSWLQH